jgi:hypothetical protein
LSLREDEKQPSKNRLNVSSYSISKSFDAKTPFKKNDVQQKQFLEDFYFNCQKPSSFTICKK